ncbi:hypothetical protein [Haemophilus haemolyticus]|uniref:hypothetical protein n=1 Tax=Haemophilus haemolyticus TaxID=726 RepID=UPI001EFE85E3|nr:hypothetical protein [Haemophilus haemolyticus]
MLLTQNAEAGFSASQANLGNAYFYGDGVQQDCQKVFYWYSEAYKNIKINSSSDFFPLLLGRVDFDIYQNLAMLYLLGLGTPKNTLAMLVIYAVKKGVINIVSSIKNKTPINSR